MEPGTVALFRKPLHCWTLCPLISENSLSALGTLASGPRWLRDSKNAFDSASKSKPTINPCPGQLETSTLSLQAKILIRTSPAFVNYK